MNNDFIVLDTNITADGTTYSSEYFFDINSKKIEMFLKVTAITGTSPTLDVTPQFTLGNDVWFDGGAFTQATATGAEMIEQTTKIGVRMRFKFVVGSGAADPDITFTVGAVAKK